MGNLSFISQDALAAAASSAPDNSPLPAGDYTATIHASEVQTTKRGDGQMIYVRLDVTGPTRAGAVVFDRMLVQHPNPTAQEIGIARFSGLCQALGYQAGAGPSDTQELVGKTVGIKTKVRKSEQYGDSAEVVAYFKPKTIKTASAPAAPPVVDDVPF